MITIALLLILNSTALLLTLCLIGRRQIRNQYTNETAKIRLESLKARRQMRDVTRRAFVAMAEESQRRGGAGHA
jgi:hypothetical protein